MRILILLVALSVTACQTMPTAMKKVPASAELPAVEVPIDCSKNLEMALCAIGAAGIGLAYRSFRKSVVG